MDMNNNNLVNDIKSLLAPKEELNKKQVALFLTQSKIDDLDRIVKELSNYSNGKVNRNILIEMAINNLIESIPQVIKEYELENNTEEVGYDTLLCPAQDGGQEFLKTNKRWEYVKIDYDKIKYLKYIALYVGAPYSSIMYWAKIKECIPEIVDNQKKYKILVEDIHEIIPAIPLGDISAVNARSHRYTTLNKILSAKSYADLINK